MARESLVDIKARMTPDEIQSGERETKKLMQEYGLGGQASSSQEALAL